MTSAEQIRAADGVPPVVPSIPLYPEPTPGPGEQSIGALVRDATTHVSTLIRSEVELARTEISAEIRQAIRGSVFFVLALAVATFSLFFLFFTIAEALGLVLQRWAAFGVTFLIMLAGAGLLGLLGYRRVRKIRKPERTITTARDTARVLSRRGHTEHQAS